MQQIVLRKNHYIYRSPGYCILLIAKYCHIVCAITCTLDRDYMNPCNYNLTN